MIPMAPIPSSRPPMASDVAVAATFGSPVRIAILHHLVHTGASSSGDLARALELPQSTVNTNLQLMEAHGAISANVPARRRSGRKVLWNADASRCRQLLSHLQSRIAP